MNRRLVRLSDEEVESVVRELRHFSPNPWALAFLAAADYDSLVRVRKAVSGNARREQIHAQLRPQESAA